MEGIATIWTGIPFNCPSTTNEIVLLHIITRFNIYETCNNGDIAARILSIKDNNYTSQLNVTITPDTAGKTIECARDNGMRTDYLFTLTIPTVTGLSCA